LAADARCKPATHAGGVAQSFPRGDAVEAALRAGAGAVLGRPIVLEALEGTLRRLERKTPGSMPPNGVGAAAGHR